MNKYNFDELGNIQAAFSTLRQLNQYVLFPVSEETFDNPLLIEYFDSPLDSPIEKKVEKIISVAAAKAVFDNPNIPSFNKKRSARNTARDIREAMRAAKIEYHAQTDRIGVPEYNRRKRSLQILKRVAKFNMAKGIAKNMAITAFATLIAGPIGGSIAFASRITWKFLPEKIKKKIQNAANAIMNKAINVIDNCCNYIESTKVYKIVEKAIDKVRPAIEKVGKKVIEYAQRVIDFAKSNWPY